MVLDVEAVTVELGGRRVLDEVSLAVAAGERVGMLGPNGAGKTTLLRSVLGLIPAVAGRVRIGGSVGYVPQRQEFAWDFPISVRQAVLTGRTRAIGLLRRPGAADRALVGEALEHVDMTPLADRPIGQLSGGQRQRVLVARALVLRPALLLLDEPFTGLDVPTQELLSALFRRLGAAGCGVLMTTHDLSAATDTCDRLCLLNRTVVADGPPAALRDPEIWLRAFGVTRSEQLLQVLGSRG